MKCSKHDIDYDMIEHDCRFCNGEGERESVYEDWMIVKCSSCDGTGQQESPTCYMCTDEYEEYEE